MTVAALRDALVERVWGVYAARSSAPPPRRPTHHQVIAQVSAVRELTPGLRRITLVAPDLAAWRPAGPDEYFGLLMPRRGSALQLPDAGRRDVRAALAELPEATRPDLRWYTVAEYRPHDSEIDVDVVLHGDAGPGSAWACGAAPGDAVGVRTSGACYAPPQPQARQLLVADETALPALAAIIRSLSDPLPPLEVHIEVPDVRFVDAYNASFARLSDSPLGSAVVHDRGSAEPGAAILPALTAPTTPAFDGRALGYAWLCGESTTVTTLRRHLVASGVDKRHIFFSGYWKRGAARG